MAKVTRIKIDLGKLKVSVRDLVVKEIRVKLEEIGSTVLGQTQRRFDDRGDEEIRWDGLWVNKPEAVSKFTSTKKAKKKRTDKVKRTQRAVDKILTIPDISDRNVVLRKARGKLREAKKAEREGVPDIFRRGGEPLRDTGELFASFDFSVQPMPKGGTMRIGSPLERAAFHQTGFTTTGPNYIPLTQKARKGWNPKLIRGHDYIIMAKGVTVPARPMVRLTSQNRKDIIGIAGGR